MRYCNFCHMKNKLIIWLDNKRISKSTWKYLFHYLNSVIYMNDTEYYIIWPDTEYKALFRTPLHNNLVCVQMPERNLKWSLQWCLTIPHNLNPVSNELLVGSSAVVIGLKILFMVCVFLSLSLSRTFCLYLFPTFVFLSLHFLSLCLSL